MNMATDMDMDTDMSSKQPDRLLLHLDHEV